MSRFASICTGLLKAGAVALVLALCGLASASAHESGSHAAPASIMAQPHQVSATHIGCAGWQVIATAVPHDHQTAKAASVADDCCPDGCACGCAAACASHFVAGLPHAAARVRPMPAAILMPGGAIDPAGLTTPPETRPPLFI